MGSESMWGGGGRAGARLNERGRKTWEALFLRVFNDISTIRRRRLKSGRVHLSQSFRETEPRNGRTWPHHPVCTASAFENQRQESWLGLAKRPSAHFLFYPMHVDSYQLWLWDSWGNQEGRKQGRKRGLTALSPSESQEVKNFLVGKERFQIPPPILYFFHF